MNLSSFIRCMVFICCINSFYCMQAMEKFDEEELESLKNGDTPNLRHKPAMDKLRDPEAANSITIPVDEYNKLLLRNVSEFRHIYGLAGLIGGLALGGIAGWNGALFDDRSEAHLIPVNVICSVIFLTALCCYSWVFIVNTLHDTCKKIKPNKNNKRLMFKNS